MEVVDSHLHITDPEKDEFRPQIDNTLRDMEAAGVSRAALLPLPTNLYLTEEQIRNWADKACMITRKYPRFFFPIIWLNPNLDPKFLSLIVRRYILDGPIAGVKLKEPGTQDKMNRMLDILEKADVPLIVHSWYHHMGKPSPQLDPSEVVHLVGSRPALRVQMAHLTGCRRRGVQEIRAFTHILIDTSGAQPEDGIFAYAVQELGSERIVFGSDYPLRDIAVQKARIDSVPLTDEQRQQVLSTNALRFYSKNRSHSQTVDHKSKGKRR